MTIVEITTPNEILYFRVPKHIVATDQLLADVAVGRSNPVRDELAEVVLNFTRKATGQRGYSSLEAAKRAGVLGSI